MHMPGPTPAECHVNTEPINKVHKSIGIARNTVNNKLTTSKHTKNSKSIQQRVSVKNTLLSPPAFDCWTPNNSPPDRPRPGLCTHASLDRAPLGFETLA